MTTSKSMTAELVWALPGALSRLRPGACELLTALNERVRQAGDPVLLELVRVRVAQLIGNPVAARVRCEYAAAAACGARGDGGRAAGLPGFAAVLGGGAGRGGIHRAVRHRRRRDARGHARGADLAVRGGWRPSAGDSDLRSRVHPAAAADRRPAAGRCRAARGRRLRQWMYSGCLSGCPGRRAAGCVPGGGGARQRARPGDHRTGPAAVRADPPLPDLPDTAAGRRAGGRGGRGP